MAPVEQVAAALLGTQVSHAGVTVTLVEVEAYGGEEDPASHAARGRTPRNAPMYGPPGRWYVYFIYGMHWCANVTSGPPGHASAVLLRGGRVTGGLAAARARRPGRPDPLLARGPAALAAVLGLTGADAGTAVQLSASPGAGAPAPVSRGPRVGVRGGADTPWRFWTPDEPGVSQYRRAVPRPAAGGSPL